AGRERACRASAAVPDARVCRVPAAWRPRVRQSVLAPSSAPRTSTRWPAPSRRRRPAATPNDAGYVAHGRPGFEQGEVAFLITGYLAERLTRNVRGLLHLGERDQSDVVGLAGLLERPANRHVARQATAAIGRVRKGGNGGSHASAGAASAAASS